MSPNDADGIANSVDPDQTTPQGAVRSGSACTVCPDLSVRKLRKITVNLKTADAVRLSLSMRDTGKFNIPRAP